MRIPEHECPACLLFQPADVLADSPLLDAEAGRGAGSTEGSSVTSGASARPRRGAFAALGSRGYRIYLAGQSLANIGMWMQSIAQDWLVLSLTRSSTAVGVTMVLQFLPMLAFSAYTGVVANRLSRRRILLTTQTLNAAATGALAAITIASAVRPVAVYAFALASGLIFAFDGPARQAFATEVAPRGELRAAIALNAAVFQAARLIGPAISSVLTANAGTGWVFAANSACYIAPTVGLLRLRASDLTPPVPAPSQSQALRTTLRYLRGRPDILWTVFLVGMVGTFGLNFPIVLTAMAKSVFRGSAGTYGLFNILLAIGSACGALLAGAAALVAAATRRPDPEQAVFRGTETVRSHCQPASELPT